MIAGRFFVCPSAWGSGVRTTSPSFIGAGDQRRCTRAPPRRRPWKEPSSRRRSNPRPQALHPPHGGENGYHQGRIWGNLERLVEQNPFAIVVRLEGYGRHAKLKKYALAPHGARPNRPTPRHRSPAWPRACVPKCTAPAAVPRSNSPPSRVTWWRRATLSSSSPRSQGHLRCQQLEVTPVRRDEQRALATCHRHDQTVRQHSARILEGLARLSQAGDGHRGSMEVGQVGMQDAAGALKRKQELLDHAPFALGAAPTDQLGRDHRFYG